MYTKKLVKCKCRNFFHMGLPLCKLVCEIQQKYISSYEHCADKNNKISTDELNVIHCVHIPSILNIMPILANFKENMFFFCFWTQRQQRMQHISCFCRLYLMYTVSASTADIREDLNPRNIQKIHKMLM